MNESNKMTSTTDKKSVKDYILCGLKTIIFMVLYYVLVNIYYVTPVVGVIVAIPILVGCGYIGLFLKTSKGKRLLCNIGLFAGIIFSVFLTADGGIFKRESVGFLQATIRGFMNFSYSFQDDDTIMATQLPFQDFKDESDMREIEWTAPEGYELEQFIDNGVRYEVLTPDNCNDRVILMFHGGAYVSGMQDLFFDYMVNYSVANDNCKVVAIDYLCAPENPYPAALEDAKTAYNWLIEQGYTTDNIVVAGDSAGGGLALALVMYLRDNDMSLPKGISLICPWTNLACDSESYTTNAKKDPNFGQNNVLKMAVELYVGDNDVTDPYISPYYGDFTGFPDMFMTVGTYEVLYNDTMDVAEKAMECGVNVTVKPYHGMFHEFTMLKGQFKQADDAWDNIDTFFANLYQ